MVPRTERFLFVIFHHVTSRIFPVILGRENRDEEFRIVAADGLRYLCPDQETNNRSVWCSELELI